MITIFTDGSSRGNPGPGGWGAVVVSSSHILELGGGEKHTTNNRMELEAAIHSLESLLGKNRTTENDGVTVYTDSSYLINGITKWVHGWKAKGWITAAKDPVENRDLWERLIKVTDVIGTKYISWKYVGGHVGVAGNERCDVIATMFADGETPVLFDGEAKDYSITKILDISEAAGLSDQKSSSKKRSNGEAYSYVSAVGGVVEIHKTWAECEARVKGTKGARYKKSFDPADEKKIIEEFQG